MHASPIACGLTRVDESNGQSRIIAARHTASKSWSRKASKPLTDSPLHREIAREAANARRLIARFGMKQADVVAATGLDERTLRSLLRGESQPHARTLHKFAAGLGVEVDELFFDARAARAAFDRATNPAVAQAVAAHPQAFADWTEADFDELYSRAAVGGELTEAGALAAAEAMNERRELLAQVALLLETHEADHLREFVAMLHKRVTEFA